MKNKKPATIFSINSDKNGFVQVIDTPFGRELRNDRGVILSLSENHQYVPNTYWGVLPNELFKLRNSFKRVLIFGLAGGVLQNTLFKKYPDIEITSIEYDTCMNDIYNYFFSGDKHQNHKILNIEGNMFLRNFHKFGDFENYFDLIILDTFSAMAVSEYEGINLIFKNIKKILRTNGLFVTNMIVYKDDMFDKSKEHVKLLSQIFPQTKVILCSNLIGNSNLVTFSSDKLYL